MPWLLKRLYKYVAQDHPRDRDRDRDRENRDPDKLKQVTSPSTTTDDANGETDSLGSFGPTTAGGSSLHPHHYQGRSSVASTGSAVSSLNYSYKKDVIALRNDIGPKLVVVMVGLPARGKSYICKKLSKYLAWCGFRTRVFNVGNRRRVMAVPVEEGDIVEGTTPLPEPIQRLPTPTPPTPKSPDSDARTSLDASQQKHAATLSVNTAFEKESGKKCEGEHSPVVTSKTGTTHGADFFDPHNENAKTIREQLAMETLEELISWLKYEGGKVAIHDATNTTIERRQAVMDRIKKEKNIDVIFVEPAVLEANIRMKLKGPDYVNMPEEEAMQDFRERMRNYEKAYQPLCEAEEEAGVSFIKIINVGKKVVANNIHGFLPSQCVFYLMQIHIKKRVLWLTRHGESVYNVASRIGGDPPLTETGKRYAIALAKFVKQFHPPKSQSLNQGGEGNQVDSTEVDLSPELHIWTSTLERTMSSIEGFSPADYDIKNMRYLNEISAGICENLTYTEIEQMHPEAWADRQKDKLLFRYPGTGGESYKDVIERLRPVIVELERMESNVLIVTHQVVMRTLLAYFCALPLEDMPTLSVPLHTLWRVEPTPYGADVTKYKWNPETDEFETIGGLDSLKGPVAAP
ncbi:hypothetical protein HDU76_008598 [Blyttiomyces sp. JEL0837]|nr:hypothetical protein HDU76_008598 [Blyttiomyces sp. JEL0837]